MILSFHPCFPGDRYINFASREVAVADVEAIRQAAAVILPQACSPQLYDAARRDCGRVFPDFSTKFAYPGKTGQIKLFRETETPHPQTRIYKNSTDFYKKNSSWLDSPPWGWPLVLKNDWADEGWGVFFINNPEEFRAVLKKIEQAEESGPAGFIIQRYIETQATVLRVVVINTRLISYWRVGDPSDPAGVVNLSQGATIAPDFRPDLQEQGCEAVKKFCDKTGLNLAGLDLLFSCQAGQGQGGEPLFLELNYYFGRQGLGGSEKFYGMLIPEIEKWIDEKIKPPKTKA